MTQPGFVGRVALAFLQPRFLLVVFLWTTVLTTLIALPHPRAYTIDSHIYANALDLMARGETAYLMPDPWATEVSEGNPIYYFPPPTAAIIGGSVQFLPGREWAWLAFNVLVVLGSYVSLICAVRSRLLAVGLWARRSIVLGGLLWIVFIPTVSMLVYGSQSGLMLLGFVLIAVGIVRSRPIAGGAGLALAVLMKATPGLFGLPLLIAGQWRLLAWSTAFGALAVVASLPIVGVSAWLDFANALITGTDLVAGQGINYAPVANLLPFVPSVALIGLTVLAMVPVGRLDPEKAIQVAILVFLALWPVAWGHYAMLALIPLTMCLTDRRTWLLVAVSFLLFNYPLSYNNWAVAIPLLLVCVLRPDWAGSVQEAALGRVRSIAGARG